MPAISGMPSGFTPAPTPATSVDATGSSQAVRVPKQELDKDAFLQLLVTQMRYQDPSQPMDTTQMMAQTSQMTTVEQLTTLVRSSQAAFASQQQLSSSALVGQTVQWADTELKTSGSGAVSAVRFTADGPVLRVGDADVPLAQVTGVTTTATA
ncbi:flagellar hook capping FlgD N-terminal domain-containing protein [Pseudokineococcus sp. 5B2Z-1]|uniref:flagellar hook assembly protein FlgD n=1 Tax=Pseudokineococcus sp. 5B2Z-1 TaxID=3132744 RepID=UPI0026220A6A|nr:flagellar hook capping FlgD N-terminal domain-containing protein [uncultured Pseudokineococcus sp.]